MKKAVSFLVFIVVLFSVSTLGAFTLAGYLEGREEAVLDNPNSATVDNSRVSAVNKEKQVEESKKETVELDEEDVVENIDTNQPTIPSARTSVATFINPDGSRNNINCPVGRTTCTVTTPSITKANYHIVGWSTTPNGGNIVRVGSQVNITTNTTFHAITEFQGPTTIDVHNSPGDNLTITRVGEFSYVVTGTIPRNSNNINLRVISPIRDTQQLTVIHGGRTQNMEINGTENGRPFSIVTLRHSNFTGSTSPVFTLSFDWGNGINRDIRYEITLRVSVTD